MVSSLIFQKFSGEELTEPPPQTPPPAFSWASPLVWASLSILGRFAPSTRASPSILGRFAPGLDSGFALNFRLRTLVWPPQNKFLNPPLFKTYVRPLLKYVSPVWSPTHVILIRSVEAVQLGFTKRLICMDLFRILNVWLSLDFNPWTATDFWTLITDYVCSGSVVVTAYDSKSGCPGSNPEWGGNILWGFDHCIGLTRAFIPPG